MIGGLFLFSPVITQANLEGELKKNTAPILLDGRTLFKVNSSIELTAEERANIINERLQQTVTSLDEIKIEIRQMGQLPVITINDEQLVTVIDRDAPDGQSTIEQAVIWRNAIQAAITQAQEERSFSFLKVAFIKSCIVIVLAVLCHLLLQRIWSTSIRRQVQKWLVKYQSPDEPQTPSIMESQPLSLTQISTEKVKQYQSLEPVILGLTLTLARSIVWLLTILYITEQFPRTRHLKSQVTEALSSTFTTDIITFADESYSIPDLLILAGLIWGLLILAKTVSDLLQSRILRVTGMSRAAQEMVSIIVRYSFICIGIIVLLQVWGLDLSSLTILASALGVGIGFGFQDIAKNFGSGLVLLLERPIQVGNFIELGEYQGIVERVGARSTLIKTLDGVSIIIPNSRFLEEELMNWDHDNPVSGLRLPVGVAYGSDIDAVRKALTDIAKANPDILPKPAPQVLFKGFGDSSVDFELRVWTSNPSKQVIIKSNLFFQIEAILRKRKIEIPFPQRDLHVRGNVPIELSPELLALLKQLLTQQPSDNNVNIQSDELN
ncbi:MAG: mechanosensitive ion channel domain-containing protein [Microcoleaceae cyanobacterium]